MASSATEVVERYLREVLRGVDPAAPEELVSDEQLRQRTARYQRAFPDLEIETLVIFADGDFVAAHFIGRGTHSGLFDGAPATGRRWEAGATAIFRVAGGRIAHAWVTWDRLALLEQLGAVRRVETVSA
jgi:predicted ester cyclase